MENELYIESVLGFQEFKEILNTKVNISDILPNSDILVDEENEYVFICDAFKFIIENKYTNKRLAISLQFIKEDYNLDARYKISFNIYHNYKKWAEYLMIFVWKLISSIEGDLILFTDGGRSFVLKRNGRVSVDSSKLSGSQKFPFEYLYIDYREEYIEDWKYKFRD